MSYTLSMFSKEAKLGKWFSRGELLFQLSAVLTGSGPKETSTKANAKSCTWGNTVQQKRLEADWLESSFAAKVLRVLLNNESTVHLCSKENQQHP